MISISLFQKRLRNLSEVVIRNFNYNSKTNHDPQDVLIYFTLASEQKVIYQSETNDYSVKSIWIIRDDKILRDYTDTVVYFTVYAKSQFDVDFTAQFTKKVDFSKLIFAGGEVECNLLSLVDNSFLFRMHSGFYIAASEIISGRKIPFELNSLIMRPSYKIDLLKRINVVKNALRDSQKSVSKLTIDIENETNKTRHTRLKRGEIESLACKIGLIRSEIGKRKLSIVLDKHTVNLVEHSNSTIVNYLEDKECKLKNDKSKIKYLSQDYYKMWDKLLSANGSLLVRRKQLISELRYVYPISTVDGDPSSKSIAASKSNSKSKSIDKGEHKKYTILQLHLPRPEKMSSSEEATFCVTAGFTGHLVSMISRFLDLPLRYNVECMGSRSTIVDYAFQRLADDERTFPLYSKGRERIQYEYAVYLLDKNIAQIRYYVGLGTSDLRKTLYNIQQLLSSKLTDYRFNEESCY